MNYVRAKLLSICGPAKLENKLSAPKVQWWDRHRITVTDSPFQKREKWKELLAPTNFEIKQGKLN